MDQFISATAFAAILGLGILVMLWLGRRLGAGLAADGKEQPGVGSLEGAVFGLFSLLVAFTFQGAAARFDSRRQQIAAEANAVETAVLRVDLLAPAARPELQRLLREYLDSRLEVYRRLPDLAAAEAELARNVAIRTRIWRAAVSATTVPGGHPDAGKLLLPALNVMIEVATTRTMAALIHPPRVIYVLLVVLGLLSSLLVGYAMARGRMRSWLHVAAFAAVMTITLYTIVDLEYPREGLLRVDDYDRFLVALRARMR